MKALQPWKFEDDNPIPPSVLNLARAAIQRDLDDLRSRRWAHPPSVIPFDDLDEADGDAERAIIFTPVWDVEIEALQVVLHGDDNAGGAAEVTFTITATGIDGWQDIEIATTDEATAAHYITNRRMKLAADQQVTISVDSAAAAWRITRCDVILHLRGDRYEGSQPTRPTFTPAKMESPDADVCINTFVDAVAAAVAAEDDDGNKSWPHIGVYVRRNVASAEGGSGTFPVPLMGQTIARVEGHATHSAAVTMAVVLKNAGVDVARLSLLTSNEDATTSDSSDVDEDATDDPTNTNGLDVHLDSNSATALKVYAVVHSR